MDHLIASDMSKLIQKGILSKWKYLVGSFDSVFYMFPIMPSPMICYICLQKRSSTKVIHCPQQILPSRKQHTSPSPPSPTYLNPFATIEATNTSLSTIRLNNLWNLSLRATPLIPEFVQNKVLKSSPTSLDKLLPNQYLFSPTPP